jgi:hypothetical protein
VGKRQKRRWKDLPRWAKRAILVAGSVQLSLMATAQADISRRPAEEINGSKLGWRLVSMINFVGPILYFLQGRKRRALS